MTDKRTEKDLEQNSMTYQVASGKIFMEKYGLRAENREIIHLNPDNVPNEVKPLIPFAEIWGISDDLIREDFVAKADLRDLQNLISFMQNIEFEPIDKWLTSPEMIRHSYSAEYIAITCLIMAAEAARLRLKYDY